MPLAYVGSFPISSRRSPELGNSGIATAGDQPPFSRPVPVTRFHKALGSKFE
ncbi:hypothetical protein ACP70R_039276 [Stipagrostis hirtigluma subsp. patula]